MLCVAHSVVPVPFSKFASRYHVVDPLTKVRHGSFEEGAPTAKRFTISHDDGIQRHFFLMRGILDRSLEYQMTRSWSNSYVPTVVTSSPVEFLIESQD
jgi:hypothetical protein